MNRRRLGLLLLLVLVPALLALCGILLYLLPGGGLARHVEAAWSRSLPGSLRIADLRLTGLDSLELHGLTVEHRGLVLAEARSRKGQASEGQTGHDDRPCRRRRYSTHGRDPVWGRGQEPATRTEGIGPR